MSAYRMKKVRALVVAALAVCLVPAEARARPAQGQFMLFPNFGSWWGTAPARHKPRQRVKKPRLVEKEQPRETVNGPLHVVVSLPDQRISVYDDGALLARSVVSTGVPSHPTPLGVFSVIGKHRWHRSNLYSAAPMPYMQRITWSGVALHEGIVPGRPASHGCIRLKKDFAIRLWHLTRRGTRVIIASGDVQ